MFERLKLPYSILTREFPQACGREDEPYYPIRHAETAARFNRYADWPK